jgi:hypothetical protein
MFVKVRQHAVLSSVLTSAHAVAAASKVAAVFALNRWAVTALTHMLERQCPARVRLAQYAVWLGFLDMIAEQIQLKGHPAFA